jgi:hypothetical protein
MTAAEDITGMEQAGARLVDLMERIKATETALAGADGARSRSLYLSALRVQADLLREAADAAAALLRMQGE